MKRLFLNSKFICYNMATPPQFDATDKYILQVEICQNFVIIEYCKNDEISDLIPFTSATLGNTPQEQPKKQFDKVEEYRNEVLNNDPWGKYNDTKLGDIFDKQDANWIDKALKSMRNTYIKSRLEYLKDFYISEGAKWIK